MISFIMYMLGVICCFGAMAGNNEKVAVAGLILMFISYPNWDKMFERREEK